jgi:hypothetical protein
MGTWESTGTPETSEFNCRSQNTLYWKIIYIIEKLSKCRCQKWVHMSHLDICNTSYDKKKRPGVKLAVWFPTTKSWESTRPRRMQVMCDKLLESSRWELQVFFRPHLNQKCKQRVMTSQSGGIPNRDSFGIPSWESRDKKPFGCRCRGEAHRILYGGRWWLPLSPGHGKYCESRVARGLS